MSQSVEPQHPGIILLEQVMIPLGVSRNKLARDIDVPVGRISDIVNGKRGISADTALRLAKYFGTSPELWLRLQSEFDLYVARCSTWLDVEPRVRVFDGAAEEAAAPPQPVPAAPPQGAPVLYPIAGGWQPEVEEAPAEAVEETQPADIAPPEAEDVNEPEQIAAAQPDGEPAAESDIEPEAVAEPVPWPPVRADGAQAAAAPEPAPWTAPEPPIAAPEEPDSDEDDPFLTQGYAEPEPAPTPDPVWADGAEQAFAPQPEVEPPEETVAEDIEPSPQPTAEFGYAEPVAEAASEPVFEDEPEEDRSEETEDFSAALDAVTEQAAEPGEEHTDDVLLLTEEVTPTDAPAPTPAEEDAPPPFERDDVLERVRDLGFLKRPVAYQGDENVVHFNGSTPPSDEIDTTDPSEPASRPATRLTGFETAPEQAEEEEDESGALDIPDPDEIATFGRRD